MDIAQLGFSVDTGGLRQGQVELKKFSGSSADAGKSTKSFTDEQKKNVPASEQMAKAVNIAKAAVAGLAIAAAVNTITKMTQEGLAHVDAQAKLARSMDATTDALRAVQIAAGDAGLDGLDGSLARLNRRLGAAMQGNREYGKSMDALNLNLAALSAMDADKRIAAIADAVKESGLNSQETSRHLQMLGFQQSNANEFFRQGGDAIRAAKQEVIDYGLSLSAVDSTAVEIANDSWSRLGFLTESARNKMAVEMAPVLTAISTLLTDAAKEGDGLGSAIEQAVEKGVRSLAFLMDAADGVKRVFTLAADLIIIVLNDIAATAARVAYDTLNIMNHLPFTDFSSELDAIRAFGVTANSVVKQAAANMQETLDKPLAGEALMNAYNDAKQSASDAAESAAANTDKETVSQIGLNAALVENVKLNKQKLEVKRGLTDLEKRQADTANDAAAIMQQMLTEEELIEQSYQRRRETMLQFAEDTGRDITDAMMWIEQERMDALGEINATYWEQYMAKLEESVGNFESLTTSMVENLTSGVGNAFESMVFDSESLGDAMRNLATGMARSVVNALGQMAAQWVVYQLVQKTASTTAAAGAVAAMTGNAAAASILAGINAYASAAAIPITGFVAAPAAMASAIAATSPMVGMVSAAASSGLAGMAHDGIDSVPREGTWLLDKGERVTTSDTSAKLDRTLDAVINSMGNQSQAAPTINLIEDASKAGKSETDEAGMINVFVSNIMQDGQVYDAISGKFGMQGVGS